MEARAKILGHAIHPILIVFPLGLLGTSVAFDLVGVATGNGIWSTVAYYMIAAGVIGGLVAAVFGLIDWVAIPKQTRAKRIGATHGIVNVVAISLFTVSWLLRRNSTTTLSGAELALSIGGLLLALGGGWLGGELVERLGVGVSPDANLDAPSSLHAKPHPYGDLRPTTARGHRL
jgi:uncharacterized membrane protein